MLQREIRACAAFVMSAFVIGAGVTRGAEESLEDNQCVMCHGTSDLWEGDTLHLYVKVDELAADVHWQKGIRCQDCHGGNSQTFELREAHAVEDGFRKVESLADMPGFCGHCHANADYMRKYNPEARTDHAERFWSSVHGKHLKETGGAEAATCTSCHPKHAERPAADPQSSVHPAKLSETCGACHRQQLVDLRKSVHQRAGDKDELGASTLMGCLQCHGADVHGMLPVKDADSPVFLDRQVKVCGDCHPEYRKTYDLSVHGQGLLQSGLLVTAACADCHDAHAIYYAPDKRSTLHRAKVAATCGKCHYFIAERLATSVHGSAGEMAKLPSSGDAADADRRQPSCTDCHRGHDQPHPDSETFRMRLPDRCGNCHPALSQSYRLTLHGQLTELGYEPAANCSDCHGAHDIRAIADAQSNVVGANRLSTCRKCHSQATVRFTRFDPHANEKDSVKYPWLYYIVAVTNWLLAFLVGMFAIHGIAWFARSFAHAREYGRDPRLAEGTPAVVFFAPVHQQVYLLLIISFLGLAVTALPLKFSSFAWARRAAWWLGGFETTRVWHQLFAAVLLVGCAVHIVWILGRWVAARRERRAGWAFWRGPDSPSPNRRDFTDLAHMLRWFVGLGERPTFERWTYWEKLDYWGVCLAVLFVTTSGLLLWFPNLFTRFLPGESLNVAKTVHAELSLMVAGFVLMMHVFNTHLRPEKFPLDSTMFTGLAPEQYLQSARPEFLERMRREGQLEAIRVAAPPRQQLRAYLLLGLTIIVVSVALLLGILLVVLGK